jgi:hypothetical protein
LPSSPCWVPTSCDFSAATSCSLSINSVVSVLLLDAPTNRAPSSMTIQLRFHVPRLLGAATRASGEFERAQWDTATSRSLKRLSSSSSMLLAA